MLAIVGRWAKSQATMRAPATAVQHVLHGGTACGPEILPR